MLREEGGDLHSAAALGTEQRIDFIDLADHLGLVFGRDEPELRLRHPERGSRQARFLDLAPVGVGIEAVISDCHLPLIRNMGGHPGDELEVVHPLYLSGLFPIPIADPAFFFIEGEAFQGQERTDHVFSHPLGLFLGFGPDPADEVPLA
jgi:hypothetical protein